jgi:hypothetical protein
MANHDTVLILGAGASKPYGFPTAYELGQMINGVLPEAFARLNYTGVLREPVGSWQKFLEACFMPTKEAPHYPFLLQMQRQFRESEIYSIDRFAFLHPSFETMARHYIALILLLCERQSILSGGWYKAFWNDVLIPNVTSNSAPLDIVTFNYDRSLEAYIRRASKAAYPTRQDEVLAKIRIHHVYGSLGKLDHGDGFVDYGHPNYFENSTPSIKLIPPRAEANDDLGDLVASKKKAVFLGFGFDELNLDVLGITADKRPKQVFASRLGLSKRLEKAAEERLSAIVWGTPNQDVEKFIHESEAFA